EWAAVLADPERLRRFASFANAPGTPDPTVTFVPERGQIRPARPGEPGTLLDTPATSRVLIPLPAVPAAPRAQEAHR
ncbi:hypothetical protein G3I76_12015, partial [Streptomyces sp. SID11233]|nr:hypothetical protein [Streptomyces sp. SID11233]